jgi:hypothetical protein
MEILRARFSRPDVPVVQVREGEFEALGEWLQATSIQIVSHPYRTTKVTFSREGIGYFEDWSWTIEASVGDYIVIRDPNADESAADIKVYSEEKFLEKYTLVDPNAAYATVNGVVQEIKESE